MATLGTIINYVNQRIAIEKFWRKIKPNMKERDVKKILNNLLNLDGIEELQNNYAKLDEARRREFDNIIHDLNDKINETIHRYTKSMRLISNSLTIIAEISEKYDYEKIEEFLEKNIHIINEAYSLLDNLDEVWPGMIRKELIDDDAEDA